MHRINRGQSGFTIIEVLMATILFGVAVMALMQAPITSRKNSERSLLITNATQLLQNKMTEMELKYQALIDQGGVKGNFTKEEGNFDKPYQRFKWKVEFRESSIVLDSGVLKTFLVNLGMEEDQVERQLDEQKLILTNLNKAFLENLGELEVKIIWKSGSKEKSIPLVTHLMPRNPTITFTTKEEDLSDQVSGGGS